MSPITSLLLSGLVAVASAAPLHLTKRNFCGQYVSVEKGPYTLYNNLWGEDNASSGSQCTAVESIDGRNLAWSTTWSWSGGTDDVKSYANAKIEYGNKKLSEISSLPSNWKWDYEAGEDLVADVSYDMFTSSTADGSNEYEIMIWLHALGDAGPISAQYGSNGKPVAIATATVNSESWNLYKGTNGDTTVFSFVAPNARKDFSANIKEFFTYLIDHEGLSSSQYLLSVGAGTEAFTGTDAKFVTSSYSLNES